jgi:hypothetical protein
MGAMTEQERILDKVRKLLAKAEGTNNQHEAEAFTAKAQELITEWAITDAMVAANRGAHSAKATTATIVIDYSPYQGPKEAMLDVVARANNCRVVLAATVDQERRKGNGYQRVSEATIIGFPADLQAVEILFTSLLLQAERAFLAPDVQVAMAIETSHPGHRIRWRNAFTLGYISGVRHKLAEAKKAAETKAEASTPGVALVLADRKGLVEQRTVELFPHLRANKMSAGQGAGTAAGHGRIAGKNADLGQPRVGGKREVGA